MLRVLIVLAVIFFGIGFFFYGGEIKDKIAGKFSEIKEKLGKGNQTEEKIVSATIKVVSGLDNQPMEGLEVSNGKIKKYTSSDGNVEFQVEVNKTYIFHVSSGWSMTPIYDVDERIVPVDDENAIYTITVFPKGSFLPLNVVSLDNPKYNSDKGIVRVPENIYSGAWLLNIGTLSYISKPCITLKGDVDLVKDIWIVKMSGNLPPIDTGGRSVREALIDDCILLKDGMRAEDLTIFKVGIDFERGRGSFSLLLKDLDCEDCEPVKVEFVKG